MAAVEFKTLERLIVRAAPILNVPVAALAKSARLGRLVNRNIAVLSYTGRRSGKRFSIPVSYRRNGDEVTVGVSMPEAKTWWRNFLGAGASLTLQLDGKEHTGHAVAQRDGQGRVAVQVRLDSEPVAE